MQQLDFLSSQNLYLYSVIIFGIFILFGLITVVWDFCEIVHSDDYQEENVNSLEITEDYNEIIAVD
jgi:cell division protein FtsI/penicillin-binding protein 2